VNEAELLFTEILNCERAELYLGKDSLLSKAESGKVALALKRRISGEPIQYILGKAEFMGLEFKVNKDVLIPRQETEILVETVIKIAADFNLCSGRILELGVGSGCISVSLAKFLPDVRVVAVDLSRPALKVAEENAVSNNVSDRIRFIQSDLFSAFRLQALAFGLIAANPPYIPDSEILSLQPEVQFEPRLALSGGKDGLDFYRKIISQAPSYLDKGGFLIMEMGFKQCDAVKNIFQESGKFEIIDIVNDYSGIERVIVVKKIK